MSTVVLVGATRGLGKRLVEQYAADATKTVYGTTRSTAAPAEGFPETVKWLANIDLMKSDVGDEMVKQLNGQKVDVLMINAGHFTTEWFYENGPQWDEEVRMYTTSSIAPVFIVHRLFHAGLLPEGSKVVLVSSEAGSIGLRHPKEGGSNYGHHASKAALNMAGKLLSMDLQDKGVCISIVHPGFMRTEMTKGVGFDKYWDVGGAVTPEEGAKSLIEWTEKLDMSKTGEYWAPRGPRDIGTAEETMGKDLSTPLKLIW